MLKLSVFVYLHLCTVSFTFSGHVCKLKSLEMCSYKMVAVHRFNTVALDCQSLALICAHWVYKHAAV